MLVSLFEIFWKVVSAAAPGFCWGGPGDWHMVWWAVERRLPLHTPEQQISTFQESHSGWHLVLLFFQGRTTVTGQQMWPCDQVFSNEVLVRWLHHFPKRGSPRVAEPPHGLPFQCWLKITTGPACGCLNHHVEESCPRTSPPCWAVVWMRNKALLIGDHWYGGFAYSIGNVLIGL